MKDADIMSAVKIENLMKKLAIPLKKWPKYFWGAFGIEENCR